MQNRYACDVGDFGKIGMLRCLEKEKMRIGVNWYLVEDESHNNDGKHIGYLKDNVDEYKETVFETDLLIYEQNNKIIPRTIKYGFTNKPPNFTAILKIPFFVNYCLNYILNTYLFF